MAAVAPLARLVLSLLVLAAAVAPRPATGGTDPAAAIDAYVQAAQDVQHFQGTVLVARDGVPLLEKGYGLASRELGLWCPSWDVSWIMGTALHRVPSDAGDCRVVWHGGAYRTVCVQRGRMAHGKVHQGPAMV